MIAQVFRGAATLTLEDRPEPEPGPGEVRLRVRACGICHTDLHIVQGDLPPHRLPVVPGHQIVGVVDAAGPGTTLAPGTRVGVGWIGSTCGSCGFCAASRENLCAKALFTGYDADGGYAEAAVVREDFAFATPARFSDIEAAPLLCAGVIGYRSLRMAGMVEGGRVGLFGFGASAHLAIQAAVHRGCAVAVVTRSEAHRDLAQSLGAAWVGAPGKAPPFPLDRAVVFAPSGAVVREALERVRPGGVVAVNAIHLDRLPEMPYSVLYGERTLKSVTNYTRDDAREFLALAASIPVRVEVEAFPLAEANEALKRLKERSLRAACVLVPGASPPR